MNSNFSINIFNSSSSKLLPKSKIKDGILNTLIGENIDSAQIGIIYVDDNEIHRLNKEFLNHDYTTDVITFPLDEESIEGEIYISVDTAKSQADDYAVSLTNELLRLAIHGTLHLIGYDDASDEDREKMHQLENKYMTISRSKDN